MIGIGGEGVPTLEKAKQKTKEGTKTKPKANEPGKYKIVDYAGEGGPCLTVFLQGHGFLTGDPTCSLLYSIF
jgi:hypothetical protein